MYVLPPLPYAYDALEPVMSERTLHFHHGGHHAGYVKALNAKLPVSAKGAQCLEDVIHLASGTGDVQLFNTSAQVWNHSFFWQAMAPECKPPGGLLAAAIDKDFGDIQKLCAAFVKAGVEHFGSGWVWLESDQAGALGLCSTHDADNLLGRPGKIPLLVCDLWEHAYYLEHQNDRHGFLQAWFGALPNWLFAAQQYDAALGQGRPWRHPSPLVART